MVTGSHLVPARFVKLTLTLAAAGCLALLTACQPPPPPGAVFVQTAPPPKPTPDSTSVLDGKFGKSSAWICGHYDWSGTEYVWVPGRWDTPKQAGDIWVCGSWAHNRSGWYWAEGYWRTP